MNKPKILINGKWVDLESRGNGQFTANGRTFKAEQPKPRKKINASKYTQNSYYHPEDVAKVIELPFTAAGYALNHVLGEDNAQKVGNVLSYLMPSRYIGWARSGYMPHDPRNPGIENGRPEERGLNLLTDLMLTPAASKFGTAVKSTRPYKAWQVSRAIDNLGQPSLEVSNKPQTTVFQRPKNTPTSLKFFERNPSKISEAERLGISKGERNFKPEWHVANYPGYQLKGLMGGSQLERQLSKNGTININQLNAYFNKASQIEKEVANKVLSEKFAGQKTIDYNQFKKAVQDELITYSRKPQTRYNDYGIDRIGFKKDIIPSEATVGDIENMYPGRFQTVIRPLFKMIDTKTGRVVTNNAELQELVKALNNEKPYKLNTFTFESPKIPIGNNKHYDATTLGHSRTYTLPEDPHTLYVMESQSDWGQSYVKMMPSVQANQIAVEKALKSGNTNAFHSFTNRFGSLLADKLTKYERMALEIINKEIESGQPSGFSTIEDLWNKKYEILKKAGNRSNIGVQGQHLHDNYLQRQLQENLKYAAENGQTKMRYPTPETAAKIEGYTTEQQWYSPTGEKLGARNLEFNFETGVFEYPKGSIMKNEYPIEHQTILKKYAGFPKLFQKLYKGQDVRTITDTKGNTWYEVDVPKGYLSREWQFKQGGKMNIIEFLKKGSGIHIKKENKGKFTDYCGGKVTSTCIAKGKASSNPAIRKRATFAANARKWKHANGGIIKAQYGTSVQDNTRVAKPQFIPPIQKKQVQPEFRQMTQTDILRAKRQDEEKKKTQQLRQTRHIWNYDVTKPDPKNDKEVRASFDYNNRATEPIRQGMAVAGGAYALRGLGAESKFLYSTVNNPTGRQIWGSNLNQLLNPFVIPKNPAVGISKEFLILPTVGELGDNLLQTTSQAKDVNYNYNGNLVSKQAYDSIQAGNPAIIWLNTDD